MTTSWKVFFLVVGSYLLGSIPTAYLAGRGLRQIDVRRYGSGTVSGSMVYEHVARWAVVPVGLFDVAKAAVPTWLGLRWGLGPRGALLVGMAAIMGHNWPVFLRFTGGRGLACFLGVLLVLFPWGAAWMLGALAAGWLLGDSAPWALAGLATLPLLARSLDDLAIGAPAALMMLALTLVKRLEANRRPLPEPGNDRRRVIVRRLFLDRDIASHRDWLQRRPE
ncbi:MAG: glycerol-3-phosphate acyltransferase [Anaerolineales bacterium]|nr:glycerol-3-phosphate acyltransferase [Anaerolineales bacterium]